MFSRVVSWLKRKDSTNEASTNEFSMLMYAEIISSIRRGFVIVASKTLRYFEKEEEIAIASSLIKFDEIAIPFGSKFWSIIPVSNLFAEPDSYTLKIITMGKDGSWHQVMLNNNNVVDANSANDLVILPWMAFHTYIMRKLKRLGNIDYGDSLDVPILNNRGYKVILRYYQDKLPMVEFRGPDESFGKIIKVGGMMPSRGGV